MIREAYDHDSCLCLITIMPTSCPYCKARYAVLFQIQTFPPEPEDEAHIGPTATYDEVIYPGFQHDITALQIQGYTSHTIGIHPPECNTTAEDTCLSTDYNQVPNGKGKTHPRPTPTRVQALRRGPLASRRRVFTKASLRKHSMRKRLQ